MNARLRYSDWVQPTGGSSSGLQSTITEAVALRAHGQTATDHELPDGDYRTSPIHGHRSRVRSIVIIAGTVHIGGFCFTQTDFFKVNRLANT